MTASAALLRSLSVRRGILLVHRYSGLVMAVFLAITGLTGSILAFGDETDAWLNADLFTAPASTAPKAPLDIAAAVEAADPRLRVVGLPLDVEPGRAVTLKVAPRPGAGQAPLDFNQIFVDPSSGTVIGRRSDALGLDRRHVIGTLRRLHSSLLVGPPGRALLGTVAIVWVFNCFFGLWLTLPPAHFSIRAWAAAWQITRRAGPQRLILDLHRATALWLWPVILILAVSSVHLGLSQSVFRPVVSMFSRLGPSLLEQGETRVRAVPIPPRLTLAEAVGVARDEAEHRGWELQPSAIFALPRYGVYSVRLLPPGDDGEHGLGPTRLFIDDQDGHVVVADIPGSGTAGDVFIQAQFPLHSGEIAGIYGRIAVAFTGLVIALLSVTGVLIWWRKHRTRKAASNHF